MEKLNPDGKLKSEMILVCNSIRNDLLHANEYIRGKTLRMLTRVMHLGILEPLRPSILENTQHKCAYVRRNAVSLIIKIFQHFRGTVTSKRRADARHRPGHGGAAAHGERPVHAAQRARAAVPREPGEGLQLHPARGQRAVRRDGRPGAARDSGPAAAAVQDRRLAALQAAQDNRHLLQVQLAVRAARVRQHAGLREFGAAYSF